MQRIGASDDEMQLRTLLVFCAIADGRLADAADELGRMDRSWTSRMAFGGAAFRQVCRAELALASGDPGAGLAHLPGVRGPDARDSAARNHPTGAGTVGAVR